MIIYIYSIWREHVVEHKTQTLLYRARLLLEEGRGEAALEQLQCLKPENDAQQGDISYLTGWAYLQLQQWQDVIDALSPLLEEAGLEEQEASLADRERLAHYLLQLGIAAINLSHFDDAA